jgi:hypothetical protein
MRRYAWVGSFLLALVAAGRGLGGEPACCEPAPPCVLQRIAPVGGWCPYGGGLLRWWDPHCFPRGGAPDDYCRKPMPRVCWPSYHPSCASVPPATVAAPAENSRPSPP